MIIAPKPRNPSGEFEELLKNAGVELRTKARKQPEYFLSRSSDEFEVDIFEALKQASKNTQFCEKIELVAGRKFPDIVIRNGYGVEVKKTTQNHWKSTGNSVLETTRVQDVQDIFLYFGKLTTPVEFKYRRYQECLYDIAVTHSPRYLIDMDIPSDQSIFQKMNMDYDSLRLMSNPAKPFVEYFRNRTTPGEEPWWISGDEKALVSAKFTIYSSLSREQKRDLTVEAMARFPEIFGNSPTKYQNLSIWLASTHQIVDASLRDRFTAGGRKSITIGGNTYHNVPRVYANLRDNISGVMYKLKQMPSSEANSLWGDFNDGDAACFQWTKKFLEFSFEAMGGNRKFLVDLVGFRYPLPKPGFLLAHEEEFGVGEFAPKSTESQAAEWISFHEGE